MLSPKKTVVLISGASKGIGFATCLALLEKGYTVIASSPTAERSKALIDVQQRHPERLRLLDLDLQISEVEIQDAINSLDLEIDILINNAAVGLVGPAESFSLPQINQLLAINVYGLFKLTNAVLPGMRERNRGMIINLSSIVGPLPDLCQSIYSASKIMVEHWAVQLRQDLQKHGYPIEVANIHPGPVLSNFERSTPQGHNLYDLSTNYPQAEAGVAAWRELMRNGRPVQETVDTILAVISQPHPRFWNPTERRVADNFARIYKDASGTEFTQGPKPCTAAIEPIRIEPTTGFNRFQKAPTESRVLISGASSGIGLATVRAFADLGYQVIATARKPKSSSELQALKAQYANVQLASLDLTAPIAVIQQAIQVIGPVDILVNNAGRSLFGPVESCSIGQIDSLVQTNFLGPLKLCLAVLPFMRAAKKGLILNVSSRGALIPSQYIGLYTGSKAMFEHFSAQLANDLKTAGFEQIRIAGVHPGPVKTKIVDNSMIGDRKLENNPYFHSDKDRERWQGLALSAQDANSIAELIISLVSKENPAFWNPSSTAAAADIQRMYQDPTGADFIKGPSFNTIEPVSMLSLFKEATSASAKLENCEKEMTA